MATQLTRGVGIIGTLKVNNDITAGGDLEVAGDLEITGDLPIAGQFAANGVTPPTAIGTALTATAAAFADTSTTAGWGASTEAKFDEMQASLNTCITRISELEALLVATGVVAAAA